MLNTITHMNYDVMQWMNMYLFPIFSIFFLIGFSIQMTPLSTHYEQKLYQVIFVYIRKILLWTSLVLIVVLLFNFVIYTSTMQNQSDSTRTFYVWLFNLFKQNTLNLVFASFIGMALRFVVTRYMATLKSTVARKLRKTQEKDEPTDVRIESQRYMEKTFIPEEFYHQSESMFIGLDKHDQASYIPNATWYETNMQIIGPTRYGKGIVLGCLMDQIIQRGDGLFYIDPKRDLFAPHIMYQACLKSRRKFYYLTLHDDGIGRWSPFSGGSLQDGLSRIENAFGLAYSGDPATDYYKSIEKQLLTNAFSKTRSLVGLKNELSDSEANRINSELEQWTQIDSLCSKSQQGFSIAKALKENAVVYVQGSLDQPIVKTATKIFILELIQESRRLFNERKSHLTTIIDEVSFLVSKTLAQALSTSVGFKVNFVLAYQSQRDLLNVDDKTVNPNYIHHSININSQLKLIYGGADYETAEWVAKMSGTISKKVTKLERTNVSHSGGETWEQGRAIGSHEEYHIHTNIVLTLPPRVCVLIQPKTLARICFSSFVPVHSHATLNAYLEKKQQLYQKAKNDIHKNDKPVIESENLLDDLEKSTSVLHAKPVQKKSTARPTKKNIESTPTSHLEQTKTDSNPNIKQHELHQDSEFVDIEAADLDMFEPPQH